MASVGDIVVLRPGLAASLGFVAQDFPLLGIVEDTVGPVVNWQNGKRTTYASDGPLAKITGQTDVRATVIAQPRFGVGGALPNPGSRLRGELLADWALADASGEGLTFDNSITAVQHGYMISTPAAIEVVPAA